MKRFIAVAILTASFLFHTEIAEATPIAGVTSQQYNLMRRAPITHWQQDILEIINEPEKKNHAHKESVKYIYSSAQTLNKRNGVFYGPSGKESYYNLSMDLVLRYMYREGFRYHYWVRKDGVKMLGDYVIVAADLRIRPKGTVLMTSLGQAIVCDTGEFAKSDPTALDVAVTW